MIQKLCKDCKQDLPISEFGNEKKSKDGLMYRCRACERIRQKKWRDANPDKVSATFGRWYDKTIKSKQTIPEYKVLASTNLKRCSCCKELLDRNTAFYDDTRKDLKRKSKDGLISWCIACHAMKVSIWAENNSDKVSAKTKRWKYKCIENLLHSRMSNGIWISLNRVKKDNSWISNVTYTKAELKEHLENLFTEGMNWGKFKRGDIHIDHIIPKSWFTFTTVHDEGFKKCWALSNLQPMWAKQNISKGNRYSGKFITQLN